MSIEFVRVSRDEAETAVIGRDLGAMLAPGDVVLLDGPLGAGKTGLVRAIALGMGLDAAGVCSPTFVLMHLYERARAASGAGRAIGPDLVHIDAYRMIGGDTETLGLDRVLNEHGATRAGALSASPPVVVAEWAERLPRGLFERAGTGAAEPRPARIRIDLVDENTRELWFNLPDDWKTRPGMGALLRRQPTRCPVTGRSVAADSPTWPFADDRARLADLHRWFSGAYAISREPDSDDEA